MQQATMSALGSTGGGEGQEPTRSAAEVQVERPSSSHQAAQEPWELIPVSSSDDLLEMNSGDRHHAATSSRSVGSSSPLSHSSTARLDRWGPFRRTRSLTMLARN